MGMQVAEQRRPRHPVIVLLSILTVCYAVAFIGAQASFMGLQGWYQSLAKPAWNPPAWVFGPVWTVLYGLMGVACWLVWRIPEGKLPSGYRSRALWLFLSQLVLNALWSWIFFAWRQIGFAAMEIGLLLAAIGFTTWAFWRANRPAGMLMLPYLGWVTFATFLNFAIWQLNR